MTLLVRQLAELLLYSNLYYYTHDKLCSMQPNRVIDFFIIKEEVYVLQHKWVY